MGRRGEKLLEGARGRGADWDFGDLDGDQQSASLRIPSRPPRHHRHLPCNEGLIIFWLEPSLDGIVNQTFTTYLICWTCRIFARVLLLVNTAAAAMVPTMMISTPTITVEFAEPIAWEASIRSFSLEAGKGKLSD